MAGEGEGTRAERGPDCASDKVGFSKSLTSKACAAGDPICIAGSDFDDGRRKKKRRRWV